MTKEQEIQLIKKRNKAISRRKTPSLWHTSILQNPLRALSESRARTTWTTSPDTACSDLSAPYTPMTKTARQTSKPTPLGASKTQSWTRCESGIGCGGNKTRQRGRRDSRRNATDKPRKHFYRKRNIGIAFRGNILSAHPHRIGCAEIAS